MKNLIATLITPLTPMWINKIWKQQKSVRGTGEGNRRKIRVGSRGGQILVATMELRIIQAPLTIEDKSWNHW